MEKNIVASFDVQKELLKKIDKFDKVTFFSPSEFCDIVLGSWDEGTYLNQLLENNYLINQQITFYENFKKLALTDLNQDLLNKYENSSICLDLLKKNYTSGNVKFLYNKTIEIYDYPALNDRLYKALDVIHDRATIHLIRPNACSTNNISLLPFFIDEDEVKYVVQRIAEAIDGGCELQDIAVMYNGDQYEAYLKNYLNFYNIPFTSDKSSSLWEFQVGKRVYHTLIDNFNNYSNWFDNINSINISTYSGVLQSALNSFYKSILVLNYSSNSFNIVLRMMKHQSVCMDKKTGIHLICNFSYASKSYKKLFIMGCLQDSIPFVYNDNDFYSDEIRNILNLPTSKDKTAESNNCVLDIIKHSMDVLLTYPSKKLDGTSYRAAYLTNGFEELKLVDGVKKEENIRYSMLASRLELGKAQELFSKYRTKTNLLFQLTKAIPGFHIGNFDNRFKKIGNYKKNHVQISYTPMDSFYHCAFRYYLGYILKIDQNNTSSEDVGTFVHKILENLCNTNLKKTRNELDCEIQREIDYALKDATDPVLMFFYNLSKDFIIKAYDYIMDYQIKSELTEIECEKEIVIESKNDNCLSIPQGDYKVTGKIDKLLSKQKDDLIKLCVIDYKTGTLHLDLLKWKFGLNLQLPFYIYLLFKYYQNKKTDVDFVGAFLEQVFPKNYSKDFKNDFYKLNGIASKDDSLVKELDSCYGESASILKKKKNPINKDIDVLNKDLSDLVGFINEKIVECAKSIFEGDFPINPKKDVETTCEYCRYKDICFVKEKDFTKVSFSDKSYLFKEGGK